MRGTFLLVMVDFDNYRYRCIVVRVSNQKGLLKPKPKGAKMFDTVEENPWYGVVSRVNFVPGGASDPSLIYRGYELNYWDVAEVVIDMYRDYLRENFPDDEYLVQIDFEVGGDEHDVNFMDWLRDSADEVRGYLDDWIANGAPLSWKN